MGATDAGRQPARERSATAIDWAALLPDVARILLGDPTSTQRGEWRYGRKGSLKISLPGSPHAGCWHCFETGQGGGVLALIEHKVGLSAEKKHRAAFAWLRERRLIPDKAPAKTQSAADLGPPPFEGEEAATPPAHNQASSRPPVEPHVIWSAGVRTHPDTPAWRYLAGRLAWPPTNSIFPDLPPSVRWLPLPGEATPPYFRRALPASAAGLVLYAFYRWVGGERGPLAAVSMEAVRVDGMRCRPRWRRTFGPRTGALFDAGMSGESPTDRLVLVEGEVSALAARWLYPGHRAMATGGSAGMGKISTYILPRGVSTLTIDTDGDSAGDTKGFEGLYRMNRACPGVRVRGVSRSGGEDAADELADWVGERLALMSDGAPDDIEVPVEAWKSVFFSEG